MNFEESGEDLNQDQKDKMIAQSKKEAQREASADWSKEILASFTDDQKAVLKQQRASNKSANQAERAVSL